MSIVLSLCDLTTAFVQPWIEEEYTGVCVDIQHEETGPVAEHLVLLDWDLTDDARMDQLLRFVTEKDVALVAAFPPCTDLAVSGARWFKGKGLRALVDALDLVERCHRIAEVSGAPWFLENPVSTISTYWRKPDHIFDPYEYGGYEGGGGDGYTKRTCLWTGGGFVMPEPRPIELDPDTHDRIHKAAPSPERANLRSATPRGFARAVFEANR